MRVSGFLIRHVVHEDICNYLFKIRKCQFLSQAIKDKKKDHATKLLKNPKYSLQLIILVFFFYQREHFLAESDGQLPEQPLAWFVRTKCTDNYEKTNSLTISSYLRWSLTMMTCFHTSFHLEEIDLAWIERMVAGWAYIW